MLISNLEVVENSPKLQDGKLIVAFPSIYMFNEFYSHGKILGEIIASSHNMRPFVKVWCQDIYPDIPLQYSAPDQIDFVEINQYGIASLPDFEQRVDTKQIPHHTQNCHAVFLRCDENFVLLTKPEGYAPCLFLRDYSELYLKIAKEIGVTEVYTVGTRLAEVSPRGKATGYATSEEAIQVLEKNSVTIMKNEAAPYFTNVILGVASEHYEMTGFRINSNHGEKSPYEDSIRKMLETLSKISGIGYDKHVFDGVMNDWISSLKLGGSDIESDDRFGN